MFGLQKLCVATPPVATSALCVPAGAPPRRSTGDRAFGAPLRTPSAWLRPCVKTLRPTLQR
eukprot:4260609-Pyramimonas_sp.AAC.1